MFEEINGFDKIDLAFLRQYKPGFKDTFNLYGFHFIESSVIKDYLSFLLETSQEVEEIIILILTSNDEQEIKELLEKLGLNEEKSTGVISNSIWLILKWLDQTAKLPKGFDLVELCNDLVVHFNFPKIEEKMLYKSLADWKALEENLETYLHEYKIEG